MRPNKILRPCTSRPSCLFSTTALAVFLAFCTATVTVAEISDVAGLVEAINNGSKGDTVRVAAGTFEITAPLTPKPGMTIRGAGAGETVITAASSWQPGTEGLPQKEDPNAYLFSFDETPGVTISDMTLRGPNLHGAVYCDNSDGLKLHGLRIEKFLWSGVRAFRMDDLKVHDNVCIDAGGKQGHTGGAMYLHWPRDSEFWNNRMVKTEGAANFYGFKGYGGRNCRFHHNTVDANFSFEFPHDNNREMEIDHNAFAGVISIPKHGGGSVPDDGYTFRIHHNWCKKSYALEWPRNAVQVHHNFFDFSTEDDGGNLISRFGNDSAPGPTFFHDNLIRNPGRGLFWSRGVYNNFEFYNNHVKAATQTREDGLFGFNPSTDFTTVVIRDNIIECDEANPRPLMRNEASYGATIENNKLENVSDADSFANPDTDAKRGPRKPIKFNCGVNGEFLVDGWEVSRPPLNLTCPCFTGLIISGSYAQKRVPQKAIYRGR